MTVNANGNNRYYIGVIVTLCIALISASIYVGSMIKQGNDNERRITVLENSMQSIQINMVTKQDLKEAKDDLKQTLIDVKNNNTRGR